MTLSAAKAFYIFIYSRLDFFFLYNRDNQRTFFFSCTCICSLFCCV